jgi:carotenoid cleavage dioxygenase
MPRAGESKDVVWFELAPCYVFHPMNAHTDGERVIAEVARYERLPLFDPGTAPGALETEPVATLSRWTLDLAGGTAKEEKLDDAPLEFPRLDERRAGLSYRHGYAGGRVAPAESGPFNAVVHYDLATGARRAHDLGPTSFTSEPVFVPRAPDAPEGEGFLLAVVYREEEGRSDLVVLDATDVERAPLATVRLPHRIPYGFHGNWRES